MDIQKEREAFEAWFESQFESTKLHKFDDGVYWHERAQMSWEAWQAAKAQAVPEGFVIVPRDPTDEMWSSGIDAYADAMESNKTMPAISIIDIYKAMIAASQEPK